MSHNLLSKVFQAVLLCCLTVMFTGCDEILSALDNPIQTTLSMATNDVKLKVGEQYQRQATSASPATVAYTSADPAIATVDANGMVTAIAAGTTTITASVAQIDYWLPASALYKVTVVPATTPATITTAPTATADVKAGSTTALVTEGVADGGTMMYAVTTANTKPATTDGFSATIPTAATLAAGTYYVWYYAKAADAAHSDSEISATAITVTVKAAGYTMAKDAAAADKGKLICTDGHIHANGEDAACTKARVAKIIYVGSSTDNTTYTHGLALALEDVSSNELSWDNSGYYNSSKTAAEWCSAWNTSKTVTSASWMLPSKNQWNTMISAAGGTTSLRDGFSGIAGASNLTKDTYWSSTEYDSDKAWCYGFNSGDWYSSWKMFDSRVRACLAF